MMTLKSIQGEIRNEALPAFYPVARRDRSARTDLRSRYRNGPLQGRIAQLFFPPFWNVLTSWGC